MTVFGSICTRTLIDRTLICNAILYHFQITLICGRFNRPSIPLTLFLLSRPLEQLEFIRLSNFIAESCFVPPTRPQRFILPRYFQSRYRRHLFTLNPFFKSPARDDLLINFLVSVFTSYKNLRSVPFNLGRMCWKQISSSFTTKSHKSLSPIRLFCARVVLAPEDMTTRLSSSSSPSSSFSLVVCLYVCSLFCVFSSKTKNWRFGGKREKKR